MPRDDGAAPSARTAHLQPRHAAGTRWQDGCGKPKGEEGKNVVQLLRDDPQMRAAFLNKVAGPIANKMFECGMIP